MPEKESHETAVLSNNTELKSINEQPATVLPKSRDFDTSWLAKNIHSLLAVGIISLTFLMYWYVINLDKADDKLKDIIIYILGALTATSTQVVSYYFGSSSGSANKSKTLDDIAKKNP
ncbi:hypothetical protein VU07_02805 [Desulfobulbus sp. F4]|nr:hypothetical protein [Desulfobulbus sp. F3]MCW5200730.1 hypothetical protein [Desulfobulbus sp. F4]